MQLSPGRHCTLVISIGPVPTPNLGLGELIALPVHLRADNLNDIISICPGIVEML